MAERFENAPLVELIAELRWEAGARMPDRPPQRAPVIFASTQNEEFFMQFGSRVGAIGYGRIERLLPPGFPAMPFQVTYRFRKNAPEQGTTIYQIGAGVFSANITPPYQSWADFRPVVQKGVELLLETRNASASTTPFTAATLRYIDAFGSKFTEGRSIGVFARDVLGFTIDPPPAVRAELAPNEQPKPSLQLLIPLASGQRMSLSLAEGIVSNENAVVMDLSVDAKEAVQANIDEVMNVFDSAHDVIHRVFVGVTKNLSHILKPIAEEKSS